MSGKTAKLFVGNLPHDAKSTELREKFSKFGEVVECDIVKEFAFIHYKTDEEAQAAVKGLHQTEYNGKLIRVEKSTSRVRQKPGMGGESQCFRCGKDGHWSKDCPSRTLAERKRAADNRGGRGDSRSSYERGRDSYRGNGGNAEHNRGPPRQYDLYENYLPPKGSDGRYINSGYAGSYGGERYHPYGPRGPFGQQMPPGASYGYNNMGTSPANPTPLMGSNPNMGYNMMGNMGQMNPGNISSMSNNMQQMGSNLNNGSTYIGPVSSTSNLQSSNYYSGNNPMSYDMSNKLALGQGNANLGNLSSLTSKLDAQGASALNELAGSLASLTGNANAAANSMGGGGGGGGGGGQSTFSSQPYDYFSKA
ncbi:DgyrCDS6927 [Dimorphilus gyrociliatus]|uniref:DgyrCDS6927 n=3 Tax=Dimorphilus gyrociliatus TaxID=2664684 RepID=A0A7I8VPH9_9ANNE|nr:DgyrCDS6927 [Dimorphilus gyrociliatus]